MPGCQKHFIRMDAKIIITRNFQNQHKTLSHCQVRIDGKLRYTFKGIELPWRNNERGVSCIPSGTYHAVATRRASNGDYAILLEVVPGRSQIMIHSANFVRELRGCLAPGTAFRDIDSDGILDVVNSRQVMNAIQQLLPINTRLVVEVRNTVTS